MGHKKKCMRLVDGHLLNTVASASPEGLFPDAQDADRRSGHRGPAAVGGAEQPAGGHAEGPDSEVHTRDAATAALVDRIG